MLRCVVALECSLGRWTHGSRRVRRSERHVWCVERCLATVRRLAAALKRGSPSEADGRDRTVINNMAWASNLRWRACLQPSVVWILQASQDEARPPAKKQRNENPTPSKDAGRPSIYQMWSPPVSPIWFGPYRLYNSPSGKGSTSLSLRRTAGADRYARREDSRCADPAWCAADDRSARRPAPPSVRTCVRLLLARLRTAWGLQAPARGCL